MYEYEFYELFPHFVEAKDSLFSQGISAAVKISYKIVFGFAFVPPFLL